MTKRSATPVKAIGYVCSVRKTATGKGAAGGGADDDEGPRVVPVGTVFGQ
jgi:hypothetical protein